MKNLSEYVFITKQHKGKDEIWCYGPKGKCYVVTEAGCGCDGYHYRQACKHHNFARHLLEKVEIKEPVKVLSYKHNPYKIESRADFQWWSPTRPYRMYQWIENEIDNEIWFGRGYYDPRKKEYNWYLINESLTAVINQPNERLHLTHKQSYGY